MKEFSITEFNISRITFANLVKASESSNYHKNRQSHGLAINLSGIKEYIFSNGTVLTSCDNDIIYLPKHSTYDVDIIEDGDCYCINFDDEVDMELSPFVMKPKNVGKALDIFETADKYWTAKSDGYMFKCKSLLYELLYSLRADIKSEYTPSVREAMIRPAVAYIHEHYNEEMISIEKLAGICHISSAYFRKIFKNVHGTSPVEYVNGLKLRRACELLSSGMYSVSSVAELSGYTDPAHFSREFKKRFGVPPSQYV